MGDPACFLDATCLTCGRFLDSAELEEPHCPHCGSELLSPPRDRTK
jgi:DNA-directed RNA polymerase subunit RPC12/RpoP